MHINGPWPPLPWGIKTSGQMSWNFPQAPHGSAGMGAWPISADSISPFSTSRKHLDSGCGSSRPPAQSQLGATRCLQFGFLPLRLSNSHEGSLLLSIWTSGYSCVSSKKVNQVGHIGWFLNDCKPRLGESERLSSLNSVSHEGRPMDANTASRYGQQSNPRSWHHHRENLQQTCGKKII